MISLDSAGLGLSLVIFWGQLWDLWSCYPACTSEDSQKHIFESECFSSGNEIGKENTNYCEIFSGNVRSQVLTRPEVSKLTPDNTRNSQVAKLSPAESRLKHIDRHTKTMNSFWISLQTFQECLLKVSERNLKLCRTSVETSKKFL